MHKCFVTSAVILSMGGCAPLMEASRPNPIDLSQFHPGDNRTSIVRILGPPITSDNDGKKWCDVYHLYTHGPNLARKSGISLLEVGADVFTLGLAEVVTAPLEAATENDRYPVTFCYSQGALLLSVDEGGQPAPY
jgi:hypothetical protein